MKSSGFPLKKNTIVNEMNVKTKVHFFKDNFANELSIFKNVFDTQ